MIPDILYVLTKSRPYLFCPSKRKGRARSVYQEGVEPAMAMSLLKALCLFAETTPGTEETALSACPSAYDFYSSFLCCLTLYSGGIANDPVPRGSFCPPLLSLWAGGSWRLGTGRHKGTLILPFTTGWNFWLLIAGQFKGCQLLQANFASHVVGESDSISYIRTKGKQLAPLAPSAMETYPENGQQSAFNCM